MIAVGGYHGSNRPHFSFSEVGFCIFKSYIERVKGKGKKSISDIEGTMIKVQCPKCKVTYRVNETKLPDAGTYVRCQKCQNKFFIKRELNSSTDFSGTHEEKKDTKKKVSLRECPRCKLSQKGLYKCEYCGFVFKKPELKARSKKPQSEGLGKKPQSEGVSKKPYIAILILTIILSASFFSYRFIVSPYLGKRADQIDKLKCEDAYRALVKLEALCENGANYSDYIREVANVWYQIELLDYNSKRANILRACVFLHQQAKEIWTAKFDDFASIKIAYLAKRVKGFDTEGETNGYILFDSVLKFIWLKASMTLKEYESYKPI